MSNNKKVNKKIRRYSKYIRLISFGLFTIAVINLIDLFMTISANEDKQSGGYYVTVSTLGLSAIILVAFSILLFMFELKIKHALIIGTYSSSNTKSEQPPEDYLEPIGVGNHRIPSSSNVYITQEKQRKLRAKEPEVLHEYDEIDNRNNMLSKDKKLFEENEELPVYDEIKDISNLAQNTSNINNTKGYVASYYDRFKEDAVLLPEYDVVKDVETADKRKKGSMYKLDKNITESLLPEHTRYANYNKKLENSVDNDLINEPQTDKHNFMQSLIHKEEQSQTNQDNTLNILKKNRMIETGIETQLTHVLAQLKSRSDTVNKTENDTATKINTESYDNEDTDYDYIKN